MWLLLTDQLQAVLRLQGRYQSGQVAEPVLDREVGPSLLDLRGVAGRGCCRQFFEEGLEPGGDDHLDCPGQVIGGIPERVSHAARLD